MILNRVKIGRAVSFVKCLASVLYLIFLPKILIWNKITFLAFLKSLKLAELVKNELTKSIAKKNLPAFLFLSDLSLLNVKILRAYN